MSNLCRCLPLLFIYFAITISEPSAAQTSPALQLKGDRLITVKDNKASAAWATYKKNNSGRIKEDTYTLPVVFHIIHQNGPENIPDAAVMDAFQRLNDAFANRSFYDQGSGVDTKIQFCMAKKDPDGNYTTGITRTYADLVTINEVNHPLLESLIKWDPDRYVNIYVVADVDILFELKHCGLPDFIISGYGGGGVVVAEASALSAIIVHEMGHALGLAHTFEGGCTNNNCLTDGDGICDTPPEETVIIQGGCTDPENSCHTDVQSGFAADQNDLKTNHMDYGNQACQHDFTQGQKDRMRFIIETQHPGWLTADVCSNDCASPAEAEFTFPALPEYFTGSTTTLTNTSANAAAYEWSVNNSFYSSSVNISYTFPGQGWYKFGLLAKPSPDEINCRNNQLNWIRVYCSIKSIIRRDKKKAAPGEVIHFSSIITDVVPMPEPVQYEWYANGTLFGTSASFDYAFATPGLKIISLITIRGACRDTSLPDAIIIKDLPDYILNLNYPVCTNGKADKLSFSVCNEGGFDIPAGLPVTFYNANPTAGPAAVVGTVFYTNTVIPAYCCRSFEIDLPAGFSGSFIYGVVNDNHSLPAPYNLATDFPVTAFSETNYTNNLDSLSLSKFTVTIIPGEAAVPVGTSVNLLAQSSGPASYLWLADHGSFSCDTCASASFSPLRYGRVIVTATSEGGCVATDTIIVKLLANGEVFIPSAFTPNGDKLNDYFFVLAGESVARVTGFRVYNRWGELVCSKQNTLPNIPHLGWDGKLKGYPAPVGVYVYYISVELANRIRKEFKGTVAIIR